MANKNRWKVKLGAVFGTYVLEEFNTKERAQKYLNALRVDIRAHSYITEEN